MKVTYLGTTVLLFDDGADQILFDCHFTRPGIPTYLFGKLSTDTKVADHILKQHKMNRLRAIFISHSHHDHVMDMPYVAGRTGAEVYGSASALNVARGGEVAEEKLHSYKPVIPGENAGIFCVGSYRITVIPSIHSKPSFFNNDLGKTIDQPLKQPVPKAAYAEGGSYDFLVEHSGKKYLIRPSYNYLKDQLNGIKADVLFLGVAGLSKDNKAHKEQFWKETVEKVCPSLIIPLHWDNFFSPLCGPVRGTPRLFEDTGASLHELAKYCAKNDIPCILQLPLTEIVL